MVGECFDEKSSESALDRRGYSRMLADVGERGGGCDAIRFKLRCGGASYQSSEPKKKQEKVSAVDKASKYSSSSGTYLGFGLDAWGQSR